MAGYHISIAAKTQGNHTLITVRVVETVFFVHTNMTPDMAEALANDLGLAKYKSHLMTGMERGDTIICEDDDEVVMLLLGLTANRRKRAA